MKEQAEKYDESIKQYKQQLEGLHNETEDMKKTYITKKFESDKSRGRQKKEKESTLNLILENASPVISIKTLKEEMRVETEKEEGKSRQKRVGKIEGEAEDSVMDSENNQHRIEGAEIGGQIISDRD